MKKSAFSLRTLGDCAVAALVVSVPLFAVSIVLGMGVTVCVVAAATETGVLQTLCDVITTVPFKSFALIYLGFAAFFTGNFYHHSVLTHVIRSYRARQEEERWHVPLV